MYKRWGQFRDGKELAGTAVKNIIINMRENKICVHKQERHEILGEIDGALKSISPDQQKNCYSVNGITILTVFVCLTAFAQKRYV